MTDREKILDRVRKLLAMAAPDNGASEQERETALRRANSLMEQHAVEQHELDGDELGPMAQDARPTASARWRTTVYSSVAGLYGCYVYYTSGRHGRTVVTGRRATVAVVLDLGDWLCESIDREAKRQRHATQERRYRHSFRVGASHAVLRTAYAIISERKKAAGGPATESASRAMVVVDHYESETALAEAHVTETLGVKMGRGVGARASSRDGYDRGREYGSGLSLNGQVSGPGQQRLPG